MKFCAIIAEYNPLHLGHIKQIEYVKQVLGAEKIVVIMSGNFTQRGEISVLDKFKRASWAIKAGADAVIELPTVFAVGNAETFATGAINLICDLNIFDGICFGVESGDKESFIRLATAMNNESKEFRKILKRYLDEGVSLAKAKFLAVKDMGGEFDENLINSPNNILGLEYTKALLKRNSNIQICPLLRQGDHNDKTLKKGVTSATSIREVIKSGELKKLKKSLPKFVLDDLTEYPFSFDKMVMSSIITTSKEKLATRPDCTEGLENRIKALSKDNLTVDDLVAKVTTKRYTETRIRRILTSNLLGITRELLIDCIEDKLYAKILAIKGEDKELISKISNNSSVPVLTRKSNLSALEKTALECFNIDVCANDLYNLASGNKTNENQMLIIV